MEGDRRLPRRELVLHGDLELEPKQQCEGRTQLDYKLDGGRMVTLGGSAPASHDVLLGKCFYWGEEGEQGLEGLEDKGRQYSR